MAPAQAFWNNGGEQAHWCHTALQAGAQLLLAPHASEGLGTAPGAHGTGGDPWSCCSSWTGGNPKGLGRAQ